MKADIVESGTPCIHYGELYTKYGTWAKRAHSYLDPKLASRLRTASPGDVIFVPVKTQSTSVWAKIREISTILFQVGVSAAALAAIR